VAHSQVVPVPSAQLLALNRAIEADPDAPGHYVLRGEEWLMYDQPERARMDFLMARQLAEELVNQSAWGYLYQAYLDRADAGLRQCGVYLAEQH
jgi:hypothetical protein